jgi:cytochrome c oxidase subunit 2
MSRAQLLIVAVLVATALTSSASSQAPTRVVNIVAERFMFSPSELSVDLGAVLDIRLTSDDTTHGFKVTGPGGPTGINVDIPKRGRGETRVTFEAKEPGTYVFECSHICGAGHGFMRGTIRVKGQKGS